LRDNAALTFVTIDRVAAFFALNEAAPRVLTGHGFMQRLVDEGAVALATIGSVAAVMEDPRYGGAPEPSWWRGWMAQSASAAP